MRGRTRGIGGVAVVLLVSAALAQPPGTEVEAELRAVAALPGEPSRLEAAGVSRGDRVLGSLETGEAERKGPARLVLVGGLEGDRESAAVVLAAVRWYKTQA
ncbi:MAG: hypothetical protein FJX77_10645, partial [Armatimonadetes bacterium]|nr:hypothetical protein [Armatimonadota bacterium]